MLDVWKHPDFNRAGYEHGRPAFIKKRGDKQLRRSVRKYITELKSLLGRSNFTLVVHSSVLERKYMKHDPDHLDLLFACFNSVLNKGLEELVGEKSACNRWGDRIVIKFHSVSSQYYDNRARFVFSPHEITSWVEEEEERRNHRDMDRLPPPRANLTHRSHTAIFQLMEGYNRRMGEEMAAHGLI